MKRPASRQHSDLKILFMNQVYRHYIVYNGNRLGGSQSKLTRIGETTLGAGKRLLNCGDFR